MAGSPLHDPWRVEDRLAHKLRDAEYLLLLVLGVMLWTAGFVDLLTTLTPDGVVLGMYSLRSFIVLVVFALGFAGWYALIVPRHSIPRLKAALAGIQAHARRGWLVVAGIVGIIGTQLVWDPWDWYPLLSSSVLLLLVLTLGLVLFARPAAAAPVQRWRRQARAVFAVYAGVEVLLQAAAFGGWLPVSVANMSGLAVPYGRVYQRAEGAINAMTNRYGWPYPPFRLAPGSHRIVLQGDRYVQALQIDPRQHMGMRLEARLAGRGDRPREVLALGFPDYGPGVSTAPIYYPYVVGPLQPSDVVVVIHPANDLQASDAPLGERPAFVLRDDGKVEVQPADQERLHTFWHALMTGYEPVHPVRALKSHLFTLTWVDGAWRSLRGQPALVPLPRAPVEAATDAQPFGPASFAFELSDSERARRAFTLLEHHLAGYRDELRARGVAMHLVTLPYFPRGFYDEVDGEAWTPVWRSWDLLRPERVLTDMAGRLDVPILPFGRYLQERGFGVDDVRALFFRDGVGLLTPRGHAVLGDAMAWRFYGVPPDQP
jgi:hypothetical protein